MTAHKIIIACSVGGDTPTHLVVAEGLRLYIVEGADECADIPLEWSDEPYLDYQLPHSISVIVGRLQRDQDGEFFAALRRKALVEQAKRS